MKTITILSVVALATASPAAATLLTFEGGQVDAPVGTIGDATFSGAFYGRCGGGCPTPRFGQHVRGERAREAFSVEFETEQRIFRFTNVSYSHVTAAAINASGRVIGTITTKLEQFEPNRFEFNLPGIKIVEFTAAGTEFFGVDNIQYFAAPLPEPAGWAMMALGFGLTGAVVRRRSSLRGAMVA